MMAFAGSAPNVNNYLNPLPSGGIPKQINDIYELSDKLSDMVVDFKGNLANMIEGVHGNLTEFLFLVRSGHFSQVRNRAAGPLP
jgi:hypothetical protein